MIHYWIPAVFSLGEFTFVSLDDEVLDWFTFVLPVVFVDVLVFVLSFAFSSADCLFVLLFEVDDELSLFFSSAVCLFTSVFDVDVFLFSSEFLSSLLLEVCPLSYDEETCVFTSLLLPSFDDDFVLELSLSPY